MSAPTPLQTAGSEYLLDNIEASAEIDRLSAQYQWTKQAFDHPGLVPDNIALTRLSAVLDVAAGTGIWTTDFMEIPCIKQRLSRAQDEIRIYVCDIDMTKFKCNQALEKLQQVSERPRVHLFEQDILKPFPEHMHGKFDLVHVSMLVYVLTKEGWGKFFENVREVLRPGGYLLLRDVDLVLYSSDSPPPHPDQEHDLAGASSGDSTLSKMNKLFIQSASGGYADLSRRLPSLFNTASLRIISSDVLHIPVGGLCKTMSSRRGSSMTGEMQHSYDNAMQFFDVFTSTLLGKGVLETPVGVKISTEDERRLLMEEFKTYLWQVGVISIFSEWVVKREE